MNNPFKSVPIRSSEITPKQVYLSRRHFIKAAGVVAGSIALAACTPATSNGGPQPGDATAAGPSDPSISKKTDELGDAVNSFEDITNYNNYYEFTTDKVMVNPNSTNFKTKPWD